MANTNKQADAETNERTVTVYFESHYARGDGRTYGPGAVVKDVPLSKANELRKRGVVRKATKEEVDRAFPKDAEQGNAIDDDGGAPEVHPGTIRGEMGEEAEKNRRKERKEKEPVGEEFSPESRRLQDAGEPPQPTDVGTGQVPSEKNQPANKGSVS